MRRVLLTHPKRDLEYFFGSDALASLRGIADVIVNPSGRRLDDAGILALAPDCEVIVSEWWTGAGAAVFAANTSLLAFVRCGVEIRNVDVEAATRAGVLVVQTVPTPIAAPVAEHTIGLMILLARNISSLHRRVVEGTLRMSFGDAVTRTHLEPEYPGFSLSGECLGIIGLGDVGRAVARLANALGMHVLAADPYCSPASADVEPVELDELLRRARIVSLHARLTPATRHLIGAAEIRKMRPDAILINTARGALVDNRALADALRERRIAGAGIDVFEDEPNFEDNPLLGCSNAIVTPHTAGLTKWGIHRQAERCVEIVSRILAGRPPERIVNPEALPRARINGHDAGDR